MVNTKIGKYIIAITAIGIVALIVLAFIPKHEEPTPASGGGGSSSTFSDPVKQEDPKPVVIKKETPKSTSTKTVTTTTTTTTTSAPKEETPSAPAPLQNNSTPPPTTNPQPVFVNITTPAPTVIVQSPQTVAQTTMPSTASLYTVTKGGEIVLTGVLIGEVRTFVSNLNNYVSWKKKVQTASVEELTEMLIANGYAIESSN